MTLFLDVIANPIVVAGALFVQLLPVILLVAAVITVTVFLIKKLKNKKEDQP